MNEHGVPAGSLPTDTHTYVYNLSLHSKRTDSQHTHLPTHMPLFQATYNSCGRAHILWRARCDSTLSTLTESEPQGSLCRNQQHLLRIQGGNSETPITTADYLSTQASLQSSGRSMSAILVMDIVVATISCPNTHNCSRARLPPAPCPLPGLELRAWCLLWG